MTSTIEGTLKHALFMARHLNNCDIQCVVIAVLLELGVPTKGAGFDFLKKAILLTLDDPTQMVTKETYPEIGRCYQPPVTAWQVEISIRRAITLAWQNRDESIWVCYFPLYNGRKPTNAEFITMIARFIELWQGCCKGGSCYAKK